MFKKLFALLMIVSVFVAGCTAQEVSLPANPVSASDLQPTPTLILPTAEANTVAEQPAADQQHYVNDAYGLSFDFPANWAGPEAYASEPVLLVEVGSDVVYPYGTGLDARTDELPNAYHINIQYNKDGQGDMLGTYETLSNMQDGESISDARSMTIRVGAVELNGLSGYEYIATLSDTAQTEAMYMRQVVLLDGQNNLLRISGSPSSVRVGEGMNWRDAYRALDEANLTIFHDLVNSIMISN